MAEKGSEKGDANVRPPIEGPLSGKSDATSGTEAVKPVASAASPHVHAVAVGAFRSRKARGGDVSVTSINGQTVSHDEYSWQHNAAAALHGWAEHEHHEAKPISLSVEDYKAALLAASAPVTRVIGKDGKPGEPIDSHEAAEKGIPTHTDYEPHPAALSKYAAHSVAKKAKS